MNARDEHVAKMIAEAPVSVRGILKRAFDGAGGRSNAIRAMCLACTGYDRETVRTCTGYSCPPVEVAPVSILGRNDPVFGGR